MRTKRRREPVFWLPVAGLAASTTTKPDTDYDRVVLTVTAGLDDTALAVREPFDIAPLETGGTINFPGDIVYATAQEIFLKRIVGKIWVHYTADGTPGTPPSAIIASAGLYVAKSGFGLGPVPTTYDPALDYSTLSATTAREPWIWRRTWLLEHDPTDVQPAYPRGNTGYGSVLDGPHVDAKTKRRVSNDDTIFLALSAASISGATAVGHATFTWELRGLASSRKPHNRGTF